MELPQWFESFTSARATPDFVGRKSLIDQIQSILQSPEPGPKVIFFTGLGGIGKTRLLNQALALARSDSATKTPLLVVRSMIDMYHVVNHTSNGLANAIYEVFRHPGEAFPQYENEHRTLSRMWLIGEISGVSEQMSKELDAFNQDLAALAQGQRLVITLDTLERAVYASIYAPGETVDYAEAWSWLLQSLPQWGDVVLVMAGRPEASPLLPALQETLGSNLAVIEVKPFEFEESMQYLDVVAQASEPGGEQAVAERIHNLSPELRQAIHLYSGGRPILLALLSDLMVTAEPGPLLATITAEATQPGYPQEELQNRLEAEIANRLLGTKTHGETILALGRVPKGADEELLADLLDISINDARQRLSNIRQYSFVKTRVSDNRVFLHDEVYALLGRQVYSTPQDAPAAEHAGAIILEYYRKQVAIVRNELNELYAPVEEHGRERLDMNRLLEVYAHRRTLLTEIAYYRLRQNADFGFRRSYRYLREATLSGDLMLYLQVQTELQAFLIERDPTGKAKNIDGVNRALIAWELSLRSIVRAWVEHKYEDLIIEVGKLRPRFSGLLRLASPACRATLDVWEGYARSQLGKEETPGQAEELLDRAIRDILAYLEKPKLAPVDIWYARAVLGSAYRVRGFHKRMRGLMEKAVEDYQRAAVLLRQIDLRVELATTLNDMGYAMAELGQWPDARAVVKDARDLRRYLGHRSQVAASVSTLSVIDVKEGNYKSAIDYAEKAIAIGRAIGDERRIGMALIGLAEAQRRYSGTDFVPTIEDKISLLRAARDHAYEALQIFKRTGEKNRQVEAWIEVGCACRDWIRLRQNNPNPRDNIERLFEESHDALRNAADLAGDRILYWKVDALVNLAWLAYFTGKDDLRESASKEAMDAIPDEYKLETTKKQFAPSQERDQVLLWPRLGKLHILKGHQALSLYEKEKANKDRAMPALVLAAEHYFWGLEYSNQYSGDYQGIRRAKDEIYDRVKQLHDVYLAEMAEKIQELETTYKLSQSTMKRFLRQRALWYGS